jgi:hypothetical protein
MTTVGGLKTKYAINQATVCCCFWDVASTDRQSTFAKLFNNDFHGG